MADQLTDTERILAKLKMAKQIVVEDMETAQSKLRNAAMDSEFFVGDPFDSPIKRRGQEAKSKLASLEKKREEIDKLIVQYMDEVKRLRLRNN